MALGIGSGDEVVCPNLTFIAPANMIALAGAKPVLVDVEQDTWNLDPKLLSRAITEKTKAIIVVHAFGHAARMDEILAVAKEHQIPVIEDNAESPGATYKGKLLGSLGDISCFSFFANKILTTGEGGMVLVDDEKLYYRLKELRDHGMSHRRKYVHVSLGFNYRMTNMQAALGIAQLERLDQILERRWSQEQQYKECLSASDQVDFRPQQSWGKSVHWLMTIRFKKDGIRDEMLDYMKHKKIDCRQMVYPVHYAKHFRTSYDQQQFPNSERISLNSMHLPSSTNLSNGSIKEIAKAVLEGLDRYG